MEQMNNSAVSPVVGVMLMLVVTIIIAAVVSAFSGGIAAGTDQAPNVQITAHYSQSQGMWIENEGPDDISTMDTNVYVRCSDSFGNAEHMVWAVNKSAIAANNATNPIDSDLWLRAGGYSGSKSFKVGERVYISPPYQTWQFLQPDLKKISSAGYRFDNTANLGNSFRVEFSDKNGKIFAKTKVTIEA
ncbi:MAG: type IV pilin N-terminal domain-containing protein [Methanoregula sp.]|jgi:FlaG/FlaF family flagellin (archaellin)